MDEVIAGVYIPPIKEIRSWKLNKIDKLYWKLFSKWVRLKNADPLTGYLKCFTCGKQLHWKQADCSHYIKRANICTRYSVLNNHPCCSHCNRILAGNLEKYKINLDKTYGKGTAEKLEHLGRQTCKADRGDYIDGITQISKRLRHYG